MLEGGKYVVMDVLSILVFLKNKTRRWSYDLLLCYASDPHTQSVVSPEAS